MSVTDYAAFLEGKRAAAPAVGFDVPDEAVNPKLFPFQRDIVRWALRLGRAAVFAECGLGKTAMQLVWAEHVAARTGRPVLVLTPLAVATQTVREAVKFGVGVPVVACESQEQAPAREGVAVTNYQKLHKFDPAAFAGVVLDESSILKNFAGKTKAVLVEAFAETPYKLCCTATPAPNDHTEMGTHAEFLGVMTRAEMLSRWFVNDSGSTKDWRLKGHATADFWRWLGTWSATVGKPSDLGYPDDGFALPPLDIVDVSVSVDVTEGAVGTLWRNERITATGIHKEMRRTAAARAKAVAVLLEREGGGPWVVWCNTDYEADELKKAIPEAVEVRGSMKDAVKEKRLDDFSRGDVRVLISKPSVSGWGMNWQHCSRVAFVGLSYSFEQFYQAVRRSWRFGQKDTVKAFVVFAETEGEVVAAVRRKAAEFEATKAAMAGTMREYGTVGRRELKMGYQHLVGESKAGAWAVHLGDCVEVVKEIPAASIDFTVFSPPFASLFTYSDSARDMGNVATEGEFFQHFGYLVPDLLRVTKPGRLLSFHCMNLPALKFKHGYIGLQDFRGDLIRMFQAAGWIYHSEVCIWKDPVTAMQRTKALGLLHKQLKKDSCMSRQGIADYLVTMRKPGDNPDPVSHTDDTFPVDLWQRYASPIWTDIDQGDTLNNYRDGRDREDERHVCPLQLGVIERAVGLWTNPGDLVLTPFAGVGSEVYVAVKMGRRAVGVELKESYWQVACRNAARAEKEAAQKDLFSEFDSEPSAREGVA